MEEEETRRQGVPLGRRCYDIYDTNDEDAMTFMKYCIPEG